jgi:LmbE family N-acetylglucosaminyl deacetylase
VAHVLQSHAPLTSNDDAEVILAPHSDDAVLSCWSVLRKPPAKTVVTVFAGTPSDDAPMSWWDTFTGATSAQARAHERRQEDAEVLGRLGARSVALGFLEGSYRGGEQDAGPLLGAIRPIAASGAMVYAPAGIGRHPDHFAVRAAAIALLARGVPVTLYADLPYASHYGWPHWLTGDEPDPYLDIALDWDRALRHGEVSVAPGDAEVVELAPEEQAEKRDAVRAYRSQYSGMERLLAQEDALRFELFWALDPADPTPLQSLRQDLLWRLGVRRGSRLDRVLRRPALRRLRPSAGGRLGRALRDQGTR